MKNEINFLKCDCCCCICALAARFSQEIDTHCGLSERFKKIIEFSIKSGDYCIDTVRANYNYIKLSRIYGILQILHIFNLNLLFCNHSFFSFSEFRKNHKKCCCSRAFKYNSCVCFLLMSFLVF